MKAEDGWKDKRAPTAKINFGANHIFSTLGDLTPEEIDLHRVADCLNEAESSSIRDKCWTIVNQFVEWASTNGFKKNDSFPTRRRALRTLLVATKKGGGNYASLDWRDVPRFVALLTKNGIKSVSRAALLFSILTVGRSEQVRNTGWVEISEDLTEWNSRAQNMKGEKAKGEAGQDHYVPLSTQAQSILRLMRNIGRNGDLAFGMGVNADRAMSPMTMTQCLEKLHRVVVAHGDVGFCDKRTKRRITQHGFRSSFRTWAEEGYKELSNSALVAEYCIAHKDCRDKFNGAYIRCEFKPERRQLLQAWADYCLSQCPEDWCKW